MKKILIFAFFLLTFAFPVGATNYYFSSSGSGVLAGGCPTGTPCPFTQLASLKPGDTGIIKNGLHNVSNISLDCNSGATSGTSSLPITIRGETERQAHLKSTGGSDILDISNCSYYVISGIYFEGGTIINNGTLMVANGQNITIKRNLFNFCNNAGDPFVDQNVMCVAMYSTNNSLVEENECYHISRHCIMSKNGYGGTPSSNQQNIFRRNYARSGNYNATHPAHTVTLYPGAGNILENNMAEEMSSMGDVSATDAISNNNRFYGNILLNSGAGMGTWCRSGTHPNNNLFTDTVFVSNLSTSAEAGILMRGGTASTYKKHTIYQSGNQYLGVWIDGGDYSPGTCSAPVGTATATLENNLIVSISGNTPTGYSIASDVKFSSQYARAQGYPTNFSPVAGNSQWNGTATTVTVSTAQRNCPAFIIPSETALYHAGVGGQSIGADVAYATEGGVLNIAKPFWDATTRQVNSAFVGATVAGVNDGNLGLSSFGSRLHPSCALANFPTASSVVLTITTNGGANFSTSSSTLSLTGTLQ